MRDLVPVAQRQAWARKGWYPDLDTFTLFEQHAMKQPDAVAVIDDHGERSYGELAAQAKRIANALVGVGVQPGDIVAVQVPNTGTACAIDLGVAASGAICLPYPALYREREVLSLAGRAGATVSIVGATPGYDLVAMMERLRPSLPQLRHQFVVGVSDAGAENLNVDEIFLAEPGSVYRNTISICEDRPTVPCDANEAARILVTSGTEAEPKMVVYSHNSIVGSLGNVLGQLRPEVGARILCLAPLSSGFGAIGTMATLARHGRTLIVTAAF